MKRAIMMSLLLGGCLAVPAAAQAWTKSFVVEWFEPAFYYGGPLDGSPDDAGTDCPKGNNTYDVMKDLLRPYRSAQLVADLNGPEYPREGILEARGFRGPNAENMYENPTVQADPGFVEMTGVIAEGFNLDGDETTGYTSPSGEKGIDNAFYKTSGCIRSWRGLPRKSTKSSYQNDGMRDGLYTVVFVLSGKGADPMNDDNVTIGIYSSQDQIVKDGNAQVAVDYTYRVKGDPAFQTVLKARSRGGVIESIEPSTVRTQDMMQGPDDRRWLVLEKARVRISVQPNGDAQALIGGYRDWFEHFRNVMGNGGKRQGLGNGTVQGGTAEGIGRYSAVGWYHALRRNADGMKDPETGQYAGISSAYRYTLKPAFVVTPEADREVSEARLFDK
jgi:hypothetical protein